MCTRSLRLKEAQRESASLASAGAVRWWVDSVPPSYLIRCLAWSCGRSVQYQELAFVFTIRFACLAEYLAPHIETQLFKKRRTGCDSAVWSLLVVLLYSD
jgi:hypothetical protein